MGLMLEELKRRLWIDFDWQQLPVMLAGGELDEGGLGSRGFPEIS
jgi:hypothetical protein